MNRGVSHTAGYTIVEVLIFLAVSGMLFVSAVLLIGGQQNRTQFDQGVRDTQQRLDDVINDLSTGLYTKTTAFSCTVGGGQLQIGTDAPKDQGTNTACLYIGRAVQFVPHDDPSGMYVYTIAGRSRPISLPSPNTPLMQATPVAIAQANSDTGVVRTRPTTFPDAYETNHLEASLVPDAMYYTQGGNKVAIGAVAFVNPMDGVAQNPRSGQSGNVPVDMIPIVTASGNGQGVSTKVIAEAINTTLNKYTSIRNPDGGVSLCFNDFSGRDQHVTITIGGSGKDLTTDLVYERGKCA